MTEPTESCFIFLIKTDCYAGNFERPMCGFMTGVLGECGVGDIAAGLYAQQCPGNNPWEEKLVQVPDEHGCHRPVSMWGSECNDVAIFLSKDPLREEIDFLRKRAMLFVLDPRDGVGHSQDDSKPRIKIKGFELIRYDVKVTQQIVTSWPPMDILEAID